MEKLRAVELCAGAGGQALGIEKAGFNHEALVEIDPQCCNIGNAFPPPVAEAIASGLAKVITEAKKHNLMIA